MVLGRRRFSVPSHMAAEVTGSRLRRCLGVFVVVAIALSGCGIDVETTSTQSDVGALDSSTGIDGTATDTGIEADLGQSGVDTAGVDGGTPTTDVATSDDVAAADVSSPDVSGTDTTSGDTDFSDTNFSDTNFTDVAVAPPTKSCKGSLNCAVYSKPSAAMSCSADSACKPGKTACKPSTPNVAALCAQRKFSSACTGVKVLGCVWNGKACVFNNTCAAATSKPSCTSLKQPSCLWSAPCTGFASVLSCDKAPSKNACATQPGCAWTDCVVTNQGKEICDGIDNDCDGITDNAKTPSGMICDDGDACNGVEVCAKGKCAAGAKTVCAKKPCNNVACAKSKGCIYTMLNGPCQDGNQCTTDDVCKNGSCTAGTLKICDDKNDCTADSCDAKTGTCASKIVPTTCNDNKACTVDSCDKTTGKCSNKPISGCKSCTTHSQCNDFNKCTQDKCQQTKCAYSAVPGCVLPTDYAVLKVVAEQTPTSVPSAAKWRVTLGNVGARYTGSFATRVKVSLFLSVDAKFDPKDALLSTTNWPKSTFLGVPLNKQQTFSLAGKLELTQVVGKKFICAVAVFKGDLKLANNSLCIPLVTIQPEFKAVSLKVAKNVALKAEAKATISFSYKNQGTKSDFTYVRFYASTDAKIDAADIATSGDIKVSATKAGELWTYQSFQITVAKAVLSSHKFLCMRVNGLNNAWKLEPNPADNDICIAATFLPFGS